MIILKQKYLDIYNDRINGMTLEQLRIKYEYKYENGISQVLRRIREKPEDIGLTAEQAAKTLGTGGRPIQSTVKDLVLKLLAEGMTHAQIAKEVGCSRDAVAKRASRLKKQNR